RPDRRPRGFEAPGCVSACAYVTCIEPRPDATGSGRSTGGTPKSSATPSGWQRPADSVFPFPRPATRPRTTHAADVPPVCTHRRGVGVRAGSATGLEGCVGCRAYARPRGVRPVEGGGRKLRLAHV